MPFFTVSIYLYLCLYLYLYLLREIYISPQGIFTVTARARVREMQEPEQYMGNNCGL